VANSLVGLALVYRSQGKYGDAEALYKRALAVYEKALGANDPIVANSLNNLADGYRSYPRKLVTA